MPAQAPEPTGKVEIAITGLRSEKGKVSACLTRVAEDFPYCGTDSKALHRTVPAGAHPLLVFDGLAPGDYAAAILHDENGNGRLDKRLGIPKEGIGFTRNPAIRMSAPKFPAARFSVGAGTVSETVHLKYFL